MLRTILSAVLLCVLLPVQATAGRVEAVSVPASPSAPSSTAPGISPFHGRAVSHDGRYAVFLSQDTGLVPGQVDASQTWDVFLRDRAAGVTLLVSHTPAGASVAAGASSEPALSADGSVVAFFSEATDLVPGQTEGSGAGLYLYERSTGRVQLVTRDSVDRYDLGFDLSGDGRWLVYNAGGTGPTDYLHVYLFDRLTGQSTLIDRSATSPGQPSSRSSFRPKISADGRYIAFGSDSPDILADQPGPGIFLYDRIEDTSTRVVDDPSQELRLSADGRWVAFLSGRPNLVPGQIDNNGGGQDLFLWDRVTGGLTLVSRTAASSVATSRWLASWDPFGYPYGTGEFSSKDVLSADGRWVVYFTAGGEATGESPNLDTLDVLLFDRVTGATTRVSRTSQGIGHVDLVGARVSADGSRVTYMSESDTEVPGQTDVGWTFDVFVFDRRAGTREIASRSPSSATTAAGAAPWPPHLSADGRVTVFSAGQGLIENDLSGGAVFAYVIPDPGQDFYTVNPCRLLDTWQAGPVLFSDVPRQVTATGSCGIPATARALAVNVTVLQPSGAGRLAMQPGDVSSETSSVNFATGETRANHASVGLAFDGTGTLSLTPHIPGGGTMHAILDVSGYYE